MNKIVAVVGMAGSGKTEVSSFFVSRGFRFIRLGQLTLNEVIRRGLEPGEASERPVREELRRKHGMAAFATLNFQKIDALLKHGNVVVDGLYSWEEYIEFRKKYGKSLFVIAVYASPKIRYKRLSSRKFDKKRDKKMARRSYTKEQAESRDHAEIEKSNKGGPIAMADYTIVNQGSKKDLFESIEKIAGEIL